MRYCILTFGCRSNQADSWELERGFRADGGVPSAPGAADVVVVNTCTVTAAADQAARRAVRRIARFNPTGRVIVTGCYATRKPADVAALPANATLVPNRSKHEIVGSFASGAVVSQGDTGSHARTHARSHDARLAIAPGFLGRTAYPLRVQTGCDERCAYCIVPSTRGPGRSRSLEVVLDEVRRAASAGFREVWITGVHLGSYGRDLRPARSLFDLLTALHASSRGTDVTFRLSSLEPMDCGTELLDCLAASDRFLPHLHLPLQHASDRLLASMRRPYTRAAFEAAVEGVRRRMPDAAIGTDVIAGLPGESEDEFEELVECLLGSALTHVHVFPYSDRPGTEAAQMGGKVAAPEIRRRAAALRAIANGLNVRFVERQLGRVRRALTLDDGTVALTDNYIKLRIPPGHGRNHRLRVRVASLRPLRGEVLEGRNAE